MSAYKREDTSLVKCQGSSSRRRVVISNKPISRNEKNTHHKQHSAQQPEKTVKMAFESNRKLKKKGRDKDI